MRYATTFLQHLRHYRGHGIHSPFVYSLIHEVFMAKRLKSSANPIYNDLIARGVSKKIAVELANLHDYCSDYKFFIYYSGEQLPQIEEHTPTAVVIISSAVGRKMDKNCIEMIERKEYLSISRRGYMLFFRDPRRPIQHFML